MQQLCVFAVIYSAQENQVVLGIVYLLLLIVIYSLLIQQTCPRGNCQDKNAQEALFVLRLSSDIIFFNPT